VRSPLLLTALCAPLAALAACKPVPPKPYPIAVRVQSDPGVQLPGAKLRLRGATISETDENGLALASLQGAPGDVLQLEVTCPENYKSPEAPLRVLLKPLASGQRPEFQVSCPPLYRHVVVAVRTQNATDLPVLYRGREIARTDSKTGAAHALLEASPGDSLALTLNTDAQKKLMPQNPELRVTVPEHDEIVVFDQQFTAPKPPKPPKKKAPPPPALPIRIK